MSESRLFCSVVTIWIAVTSLVCYCKGDDEFSSIITNALTASEPSGPKTSYRSSSGAVKEPSTDYPTFCSKHLPGYANCVAEIEEIIKQVQSTPCMKWTGDKALQSQKGCRNQFSPEWRNSMNTATKALKKIDKNRLGQMLTMLLKEDIITEVERDLVRNAAVVLIETSPGLAEIVHLDRKDVFPELNAAPRIEDSVESDDNRDYQFSSRTVVGEWNSLNLRSPVSGSESRMDYFREDDAFNQFHFAWHDNNHKRYPKRRFRERFASMHRILVYRYLTARRVEGIEDITPLDANIRNGEFSTEYTKIKKLGVLRIYHNGPAFCRIPRNARKTLSRFESNLRSGIKSKSLENYTRELEDPYHNDGHGDIQISCHDMMGWPAVSGRLPYFWRWHLEIDLKYQEYFDNQNSVTRNDLTPPYGLTIQEAYITSRCNEKNQAETYWDKVGARGSWYQLNHSPVKFHIILRNAQRSRRKVIVRIFMGLDEFWKTTKWYFEMDRFVHTLEGSPTEEIVRDETLSGSTTGTDNPCGMPQHMYLPKGRYNKPVNYRMLVFVNDVDERVDEGQDETRKSIMCGYIKNYGRNDQREYGFPLAKPWEANLKERVISNQDSQIGNVSTVIQIVHTGLPSSQCDSSQFTLKQSIPNEPSSPATTKTPTERCAVQQNGVCFFTSQDKGTASDAKRYCKRYNGVLLPSIRISSAILSQLRTKGKAWFWTRDQSNGKCIASGLVKGQVRKYPNTCTSATVTFKSKTRSISIDTYALCARKAG